LDSLEKGGVAFSEKYLALLEQFAALDLENNGIYSACFTYNTIESKK